MVSNTNNNFSKKKPPQDEEYRSEYERIFYKNPSKVADKFEKVIKNGRTTYIYKG